MFGRCCKALVSYWLQLPELWLNLMLKSVQMKVSRTIKVTTASEVIDLLTLALPDLSKGRLKDAMNKGHCRSKKVNNIDVCGELKP